MISLRQKVEECVKTLLSFSAEGLANQQSSQLAGRPGGPPATMLLNPRDLAIEQPGERAVYWRGSLLDDAHTMFPDN
jgi:hypothetical protein